ncbi:MAG: T9SS type A sorting domain-containing protein, partial [Candidatus Kapaibacterium sp.]
GNVYAATVSGLLRSTDSGGSWMPVVDSMCLAVAAEGPNVYISNDSGFFRSTDGGSSWNKTSADIYGLIYTNGKNIYAGPSRANDVTCYVSTDFGATWTDLNQSSRSTSLVISGPNIIKGSNNTGIWYRPLPEFLGAVGKQSKQDLSLSPNPTIGIITAHNASSDILHVTVSSILGQRVIELDHPYAPDFTLDLSKLPSGTYFARFSLPNEVIIRKIMKE